MGTQYLFATKLQTVRRILGMNGYSGTAGRAYTWGVHGTKVAQKIIDYMYENATVYLDRERGEMPW